MPLLNFVHFGWTYFNYTGDKNMSKYEVFSIVFSSLAFAISFSALIMSIIKNINERKLYKKNYITNSLITLRTELFSNFSKIEFLNPEISMAKIFSRVESEERFNLIVEADNLYTQLSNAVTTTCLIISSYKPTQASINITNSLQKILEETGVMYKLLAKHKKDEKALFAEYKKLELCTFYKEYIHNKYIFITELNDLITHFVKDEISMKEINSQLFVLGYKDKN